jgi:peptidoglycan/LPS O-acetylase OafA/YrhL
MVLGAHSAQVTGVSPGMYNTLNWFFDGSLGVRFFFVISGFLITWLMVVEQRRNGRISLRDFYIRRALRIFPVYYAFLAVLFVLQVTTVFHLGLLSWIGNLTFTTNFLGAEWANGHLWSLAQEEQFYLLWPTLFIFSGARRRTSMAACILAAPILLCPVIRVLKYFHVLIPVLTNGRGMVSCDSIAIGCACALLFAEKRDAIRVFMSKHGSSVMAVGVTFILIPYVSTRLFRFGFFTVPFGETSQAVGFAMLLLHGISVPEFSFYKALNWRWICEIGVLSYSIYIWQQIFCSNPAAFGLGRVWWMTFPLWLIPAFAVAVSSFYFFERPLFRLRARFRAIQVPNAVR